MNKKVIKTISFILVVLALPKAFAATEGRVTATAGLKLRTGPGQSYKSLGTMTYNSKVSVLEDAANGNGCNDKWYKLTIDNVTGYACSTYIEVKTTENNTNNNTNTNTNNNTNTGNNANQTTTTNKAMKDLTDEEFEAYLDSQKFPESYKVKLRALHKKHPTWIFKGNVTKYTWSGALDTQDEIKSNSKDSSRGNSFLRLSDRDVTNGYESYLSTQSGDYNWYTNKFVAKDGGSWYQANRAAVALFMDPRNYLDEQNVFVFQDLLYDPSYQTENVVKTVLYSAYFKQFSPYFMTAGKTHNTNPIFLAALARQEVGTGTTNVCSNGKAGKLSDGVDYTGYYNFYNIGAYSSKDPKLLSLQYAKKAGWNSPEKAIVGGSVFISTNYVNKKQNTLYYQKYNFNPQTPSEMWHQYTTNINSLKPQSQMYYTSYKSGNVLETAFVFEIPIFANMSESSPAPKLGNPNNYLKTLTVNGESVPSFDGAKTSYDMTIKYTDKVTIAGSLVASTAKASGFTTVDAVVGTTSYKVNVTSANGVVKTYTINLTVEAKPAPEPEPTPEPTPEPEQPKDNEGLKEDENPTNNEVNNETNNNQVDEQPKDDNKIDSNTEVNPGNLEKPDTNTETNNNNTETNTNTNTETNTNTNTNTNTSTIVKPKGVTTMTYHTYHQYTGWINYVNNGKTSGFPGKGKRVEAFIIQLNKQAYTGNVEYRSYVQGYGWEATYKKNGTVSGTKSRRIDAIQIKLTGEMAKHYDIYYRVYVQKLGWLGIAKNGAIAGTTGYNYRIEAMDIIIVEKGKTVAGYGKGKAAYYKK